MHARTRRCLLYMERSFFESYWTMLVSQHLYLRAVYFIFGLYVLTFSCFWFTVDVCCVCSFFSSLHCAVLFLSHSNIEYWIHRVLISPLSSLSRSLTLVVFFRKHACAHTPKPFYVITATCMPLIVQTLIIRYYIPSFAAPSHSILLLEIVIIVVVAVVVVVVIVITIIWQASVSRMNFWNCFHFHTQPISFCHTFVENGNRASAVLSEF